MRTSRRPRAVRIAAALLAGILFALATPPVASAQEGEANLWTRWWRGATNRELPAEIPFIVVVSIPAMVVITPIWLVQRAYARLTAGDDESK